MASNDGLVIVDDEHLGAVQSVGRIARYRRGALRGAVDGPGKRRRDREASAVAHARAQAKGMVERFRHAPHDREPETESADRQPVRDRPALELVEDHDLVGGGDAGARVPNLDAHERAAAARSELDAAALGVLDSVGQQVLQDAAQHQGIGDDRDVVRRQVSARFLRRARGSMPSMSEANSSSSGTARRVGTMAPASSLEMSRIDFSRSSMVVSACSMRSARRR